MNTQKQIALIVTLFFVLIGGCAAYTVVDIPIRAEDQIVWHQEQSIERGALLFANNCRTCHGIQGQGGVGLPLNKADFQNQDPIVLRNNRALLERTLYCGRAGTAMPAWLNTNGGSLNVRQVEHLINLITAPISEEEEALRGADGTALNKGWEEAVHFAENLNHETVVVVGGETLATIARDHELGIKALQDLNAGLHADATIKKGTKIKLPTAAGRTETIEYKIRKDRETLRKIADSQLVGTLILADLNGIGYVVDEKKLTITLTATPKSQPSGLVPGAELALPGGSTYIVKAGDTVAAIATKHGITQSDVTTGNANLVYKDQAKGEVDSVRRLKLAANPVYVVSAGQTAAIVAEIHGITVADLASANGKTVEQLATISGEVKLPANAQYYVQTGDSLAAVAEAHRLTADVLAGLNGLKAGDIITPNVALVLPKVEKLRVSGQSLDDISKTFSNVTALSLAEAQNPPSQANSVYAIGTQLILPHDAWGAAAPIAKNPGTACVENAVPASAFETLIGGGGGGGAVTPPATQSRTVLIEANANDWTVTADGTKQAANKGVVAVAKGTSIKFTNVVGVHTITLSPGGVKDSAFTGVKSTDIPFNDVGTFKILCDIHPAMLATVFVQ